MFERNFTKNVNSECFEQEALVAKSSLKNKSKGNKKKYNGICNYCQGEGHWVRNCKKWIADGRSAKNATKRTDGKVVSTNVALLQTSCSEACSMEVDVDNWWIDNGVTKHMTNSSKYFVTFEAFAEPNIIKAAG